MATYDYLMLSLARGPAARAAFGEAVAASGLAAAGAKALGLFTPQLGWESSQAALLIERGDGDVSAAIQTIAEAPQALSCERHVLTPTARPLPGVTPKPGGIYVHRWFEIEAASFDDFVALSTEAWPRFEGGFDTWIFGLFEATSDTVPPGRRRLLLMTRYADHGVWEASRDPAPEARQAFMKRAALTLTTRAASTLLTPAS
jgi:hypothetical protein